MTKSVEPLLPVELGAGKIKFAQGMKAGRWVFATGLMAQDFVNGIAPDVLAERAPHAGLPKREKEALRIFENLDAVLRAAGTDRSNLVRTDQYYTTVKAVPPYQQVRREFLDGRIPPSTSIAQQALLLPGADMNIQAMAAIPEPGFKVEHLKHEQLAGRPTSGYSPALTVGDFIFLPGITSLAIGDEPRRNGVAAAALMAEGAQWGGQPIKLETEFIITKRMTASLALAGATLEDVVHAQVYLTDRDDYSAFNAAWTKHFGEAGPTVSIIPCIAHGLAPYDGKIEINVIAAKPGSAAAQAASRCRRRHRIPPSAAGGEGGRSALHPGLDGGRSRWAFARGRRRSAAAVFLVIARDAGGSDHRQHRAALRGRRHLARQRGAGAAVPHRYRRVLPGLQSVGAPARRPSAAVFRGRGSWAAAGAGRHRDDGSLGLCAVSDWPAWSCACELTWSFKPK